MNIENLNKKFANAEAKEVLEYFLNEYKREAALSSSLGAEDQVLTDMILKINKDSNIFTLDTGRLHPETYDVMDATNLKYGIKLEVFFPKKMKMLRSCMKLKVSMDTLKALKIEKIVVVSEKWNH